MRTDGIIAKIRELKLKKTRVITNCYIQFKTEPDKEWNVLESNNSLVIVCVDSDGITERLFFYTNDIADLLFLIGRCNKNSVIEIITRDRNELVDAFKTVGFSLLSRLIKYSVKDIAEVSTINEFIHNNVDDTTDSYLAELTDSNGIYNILYENFDTRISRLPVLEEINNAINNNEILICKDDEGSIKSLLQVNIMPKSYYISQIINHGDKRKFHDMIGKSISDYIDAGGKYMYAWAEETNPASQRLFQKYGMKSEGLYLLVFAKNN